mgnify:CR=1 FL=1
MRKEIQILGLKLRFKIKQNSNSLNYSEYLDTNNNDHKEVIPDNKLNSDFISKIYWIWPNKNDDCQEDIVIETNDGSQYSFYLNKNISLQKTASFNTFADDLIPNDIDIAVNKNNINEE